MEGLVLFILASLAVAAPVAFILFALQTMYPPWLPPVLCIVLAILYVFIGGVNVSPIAGFPAVVNQLISTLMIGFGGWVMIGWRH